LNGALRKWAKHTANSRIRHILRSSSGSEKVPEDSDHESDWEDDSEDDELVKMTPSDMYYRDGELSVDMRDDNDNNVIAGLRGGEEENDKGGEE
jgi:hypothetical protein